jgi:acetyltransferase
MTVRNLDCMFRPRSIALVGASRRAGSIGAVIARNLVSAGFDGPVWFVNPNGGEIEGRHCATSVEDLPTAPDLAVIATPPDTVPGLVDRLARRGTRSVVVITAGFGEGGDAVGIERRQRMFDAARPHLLRIVGPNCVGIQVPGHGVNASFVHLMPSKGGIAFVAQSGAVVTSVVDWASGRGIGFSHLVSLGDMADVDFGDMLDFLAADPGTEAVLLYVEAVTSARKFMSAARACARLKPVIVIKAGRHAESARAASSHTGALAGSDAVYDAAFSRAGMLRVRDLGELFDAVETLRARPRIEGDRLAILTNGGGVGILATDDLLDLGGRLAEISPNTKVALDAMLPATWSRGNPVDIVGDADAERYKVVLKVLLSEPNADAILVLNCPTAALSGIAAADAVIAASRDRRVPVLTCWLGEPAAAEPRRRFQTNGIPTFQTPRAAVQGFMHLVEHRRNQRQLMEVPQARTEGPAPDRDAVSRLVARVLAEGREWLSEPEAKTVLAAYGIPTADTVVVKTPDHAASAAVTVGLPVALKILSPDITHKTDVGGVTLDLESLEEVRNAAVAMLTRVTASRPDARIEGFTVQRMIKRKGAVELILGMVEDSLFGPVVMFGHGGTAVEVINDKALALPPLNVPLAHALMQRTRVRSLLDGIRGGRPAAIGEVAANLVRLSQLVTDFGEIRELDINPLLADADGVIALDARVRVGRAVKSGEERLAICPYPAALESRVRLRDGVEIVIRAVRPEDATAFQQAFKRQSSESVRMRFFGALTVLSEAYVARLTQIDYDREMALVAFGDDGSVIGVARLSADPDNERAEYAIIVSDNMHRRGLGETLMRRLIDYARKRGIGTMYGDVLAENRPMLALAAKLGFASERPSGDSTVVRTSLALRAALDSVHATTLTN